MKITIGTLGAAALLMALASGAQAQNQACFMDTRKAVEASLGGMPLSKEMLTSIKDGPAQTCYEYGSILSADDMEEARESCQDISGTLVAKCESNYRAVCEGIYGKPMNIYYYGRTASTFGAQKEACLNPPVNPGEAAAKPGTWVEK